VLITARKAYDLTEREGRHKRGGGEVRGDSAVGNAGAGQGWEAIAGNEPTPELAAQAVEEYQRLLGQLGDDELRAIAVWKMEGYTNQEIADRLGCALPTVERRLRLIRKTWSAEMDTDPPAAEDRLPS
jgi:DNA-directed RNA polymerase specialized sigma24 family protein